MHNKKVKLYKIILILSIVFCFIYMIISLNGDYKYLYDTLYTVGNYQVKLHKLFIDNYLYDNNFYIINPGILLAIFGNNYIFRFIVTLILISIYFFLVYKISVSYLNNYQKVILFLILLCGISQDYMLSIFLYNEFIYEIIFLISVYIFCIKLFDSNSIYKTIIFSLLIILFSINSFCLLYIVLIPYIFFRIIINNFNNNNNSKTSYKLAIFISIVLILYLYYLIINTKYPIFINSNTMLNISDRFITVLDITFNMFGISSGNNLISMDSIYIGFFPNDSVISPYSLLSIYGITVLCRFIFMIFTIIIAPILLLKNKSKNSDSINKLALFNIISIICNIIFYALLGTFSYSATDIKYFMFNFIIMFILDIYVVDKYLLKYDFMDKIITLFFVLFVILNIITNIIYI